MVEFPPTPTVGQTFDGMDGQVYLWDGVKWRFRAGGISIGDAPPTAPPPGSLWFNSDDAQLYIYYPDPTSSQWVITINPAAA